MAISIGAISIGALSFGALSMEAVSSLGSIVVMAEACERFRRREQEASFRRDASNWAGLVVSGYYRSADAALNL
jgi:hypothetical protein